MLPPHGATVNISQMLRHTIKFARLNGLNQLSVAWLSLVWARITWKHRLDCFGSFDAALLLEFSNPIGYGLNHFARGLGSCVSLDDRLVFANPLVLFDYSNSFLF